MHERPALLLIGNIKLPSFFQSRTDTADTRYLPRYLEDLDGVFEKHLSDGSDLPLCPIPWVETYNCFASQITVPAHDLDFIGRGPQPDPEIWTSYMPVGGVGSDSYADFATQLQPYLDKVIRYYQGQLVGNGRYYYVSTNLGEQADKVWTAFGKTKMDIWGKPGPNGEKGDLCINGSTNLCYARWPVETYPDVTTYLDTVHAGEADLGDVWQDSNILVEHMSQVVYDVVEQNTHSNETFEIATSDQVRTMTKAGLFVALAGCAVAGYVQPGSPSFVDTGATVQANVMMSYLYGSSQAIAASGDPFWRGHDAFYPTMYLYLKSTPGSYLGRAHLERNKAQFARSGGDGELREQGMEMLAGDPFMTF
jgi:hypothetical protein